MNFGAHLIPQLNPQTSAAKFNLKTRVSLFLGLELKSGSSHVIWSSQLTAPSGLGAGVASRPLDSNRAARICVPLRRLDSFVAVGSKSCGLRVVVLLPLSLSRSRAR